MKKQISRGIILSLLSQGISVIIGLIYTPVMVRILGQNEYGLYQLVLSTVNYLNLMNFGFNGAYIRYFVIAKKKSENDVANLNGMFMKIFTIIASLCLCAGFFLYFNIDNILGDNLTINDYILAKKLLILMVFNISLSFINSLFVAYMSANEQFVIQKFIGIIANILVPLISIPLLCINLGSLGITSVAFSITVLRLLINATYCLRILKMEINIKYFDKEIFKELSKYTFFIFLSDVVDQLNSNMDKFLLGKLSGTIAVAIYSIGFNLKNYFTTVSWIVPEMFVPEANRLSIDNAKNDDLNDTFIRVGRFNNYLMLLLLSGFFLVGKQFIYLWVGNEYNTSYYAALILMLSGYIPAVQTLGVNIQNAKNMHKIRSAVYFGVACINVVISVFLIKRYGVIGTCLGTLFSILIGNGLFMNFYYHFKIKLNVIKFWKEMLKWLVPVVILSVLSKLVLYYFVVSSWVVLFVFCCAYGLSYILLLYAVGLDNTQKTILKEFLKKRQIKNEDKRIVKNFFK